jgi:kynurenine formamidase
MGDEAGGDVGMALAPGGSAAHELGIDRLDTAGMLAALHGTRDGRVFDLATEVGAGMPHPDREIMHEFVYNHYRTPGSLTKPERPGFEGSVEVITSSLHIGTHIDGFAHITCGGIMHGGHDVRDVFTDFGWSENGMEHSRPLIGRGVLLDVAAALGMDALPDLYEVTPDDIRTTLDVQGSVIRRGDIVLIRTGWMKLKYAADPEGYFASQPGVGVDAGLLLYESGMAVMGTDTSGTEVIPFRDIERTTHRALLVERGVPLLEIMALDELAGAGVHEFALVCLPLKLTGATGSWIRPVAIT